MSCLFKGIFVESNVVLTPEREVLNLGFVVEKARVLGLNFSCREMKGVYS